MTAELSQSRLLFPTRTEMRNRTLHPPPRTLVGYRLAQLAKHNLLSEGRQGETPFVAMDSPPS